MEKRRPHPIDRERLVLKPQVARRLPVAPARQAQRTLLKAKEELPGPASTLQSRQPAADRYIVLTKGLDNDEPGLAEIIGEYVEKGRNHGRKVYQKISQTGDGFDEVFMYFWDSRDGSDLEGWWFGNNLGGTQVWSYCRDLGVLPPSIGWQIPWDGPIRTTLRIVSKADQQRQSVLAMVEAVQQEVESEVSTATSALNQAKSLAGNYREEQALDDAYEVLQKVSSTVSKAEAKLAKTQERMAAQMPSSGDAAQHGADAELAMVFSQLASRFHSMEDAVSSEVSRIQNAKANLEKDREFQKVEHRDRAVCVAFLPEAIQLTNAAEDAVDKARVTSKLFDTDFNDAAEEQYAVDQTEKGALAAQTAIKKARTFLAARAAVAKRFQCEQVRLEASAELGQLQSQLQELQGRLVPLLAVRKQHAERQAKKQRISEVRAKLAPAEVDVDRAEEITGLLSGEGLDKELLEQAEDALDKASQQVAEVSRLVEELQEETADARDASAEELSKMEARCKTALERAAKLKGSQKEANEHFAAQSLLKEACEKVKAVQDAVERAADAEGPFLMGIEDLPSDWNASALKACGTAAMAANTAVTIARMFIATKLVEVRRFSPGPSAFAQKQLGEYQDQLEVSVNKLNKLKQAAADRRKKIFLRESESQVTHAEGSVERLSEKAAIFEDDAQLLRLNQDELRRVQDEAMQAEKAAHSALEEARKFITEKQIESKNHDAFAEVGAELIRHQTRLSNAESMINKCRQLAASVDARLASKQIMGDANGKVKAMEEKVSRAKTLVARLCELRSGSEKEIKEADVAVAEAGTAAKTVSDFLEMHHRGHALGDLAKLLSRVKQAQDCMHAAAATMRERGERLLVNALLREVEEKMKETQDSINKACLAEAALLTGTEELSVEAATAATASLTKSIQTACSTVSSAKTLLAMKRLNAKRFSAASADQVDEVLIKAQSKLEVMAKDLTAVRSGVIERQQVQTHMEVTSVVADLERNLQVARHATEELAKLAADPDPKSDAMKASYDRARKAHAEVTKTLQSARDLVAQKQKTMTGAAENLPGIDINSVSQKVQMLQGEFDKQKNKLVISEHKFVARKLRRDAQASVEGFEQRFQIMMESTAPVIAESWQEFMASIFLEHCVDALRAHMQKALWAVERLLAAMGATDGKIIEAEFVRFVTALPELQQQHEDFAFSEDDVRSAFRCMDQKGCGQVLVSALLGKLKARYLCSSTITMTDTLVLKGSKTIRKLELNEALEALEAPSKDEDLGLLRVKVRAERDGKEGFVTVTGSQGTIYLTPCSAVGTSQKKLEKQLEDFSSEVAKARKNLEKKAEELKAVPSAPLAEARGEVVNSLLPRLVQVQGKLAETKVSFAEVQTRQGRWKEVENKRRKEVLDKKAALASISDLSEKVHKLVADADKVVLSAEPLSKSSPSNAEGSTLQAMELRDAQVHVQLKAIEQTQEIMKVHLEEMSAKGPTAEARSALLKLRVQLTSSHTKCKKQASAIEAAKSLLVQDAYEQLVQHLRAHAQQNAITPDSFVKAISLGDDISIGAFKAYLAQLSDFGLKAEQLDLACKSFRGESISKLRVAELLQEYWQCVKEIGITSSCQVKNSKTVRKLQIGEIVEVLESNRADESVPVQRSRCRALADSAEGWVSTKGTHGTDFLVRVGKPYFECQVDIVLHTDFDRGSSEVQQLRPGEVIELLEGPLQEPELELHRVRVKTSKDGITGWVTERDSLGGSDLRFSKQFICKASVALTNDVDIDVKDSFLRKLEVDETLDLLEEITEVSSRGIRRAKMRARSDNLEGWVTLTGNHGKAYVVEDEECHARVARSCALVAHSARATPAGKSLRMLEEGEPLQVLEGPKVLKIEGKPRARGRSLRTGAEGWFDLVDTEMAPWAIWQSCVRSAPLTDCLDTNSAKTLRMVQQEERLEALEAPVVDDSAGYRIKLRVRAEKDGADGFMPVSDEEGNIFLEPVIH